MKQTYYVLLDIDGTLIDSNEQHARSWQEYLAGQGLNLPVERLSIMIGMGGDRILKELYGGSLDKKRQKKMTAEIDELYLEKYAPRVKPLPGAAEFLAAMHARGLRVALATSARQELMEVIFRLVPLKPFIVGATTSSDVNESKPSPDIFLTAIRKFGFEPRRTVVVGDTPYDIMAAHAVPCPAIAVRTGHYPYQMLSGADEVWKDVQDLTRNMNRSLLGF